MINESIPKIDRVELYEKINQIELDKEWRKRALRAGLCWYCGNHVEEINDYKHSRCVVCGRTYTYTLALNL